MDRLPPKRQAVDDPRSTRHTSILRPSSEDTDAELWNMAPEEMISFIHNMQAVHAGQIAELRNQHAIVSHQLDQLRNLLSTHFTSQINAIQSVQGVSLTCSPRPSPNPAAQTKPSFTWELADRVVLQSISSIFNPQPVVGPSVTVTRTSPTNQSDATPRHIAMTSSRAPVPAATRGPTPTLVQSSMSATPQRDLSDSPSTRLPGTFTRGGLVPNSLEELDIKITPSLVPNEPPTVEPSGLGTVQESWQEYRYGRNGNPSLESLDAQWGARWRSSAKMQTWYSKRKAIWDKITQYIADGIDEQSAVTELDNMRRGRTLNWLSRILLEDRKATKKQRKEAQQAANAAKRAMQEALPIGGN